jgi:CubicO group peptidase (beta-lactamase class C family)
MMPGIPGPAFLARGGKERSTTPHEVRRARTRVSYQSTGIAMPAEIVHQVTGVAVPEFFRREFCGPLGMLDTSLGWQPARAEQIAGSQPNPKATTAASWPGSPTAWRPLSSEAWKLGASPGRGDSGNVDYAHPATNTAVASDETGSAAVGAGASGNDGRPWKPTPFARRANAAYNSPGSTGRAHFP